VCFLFVGRVFLCDSSSCVTKVGCVFCLWIVSSCVTTVSVFFVLCRGWVRGDAALSIALTVLYALTSSM